MAEAVDAGRRRLLRREVRRERAHRARRRLQPRAVRRHALPRHRPDRRLRHHRASGRSGRACGASRRSPARPPRPTSSERVRPWTGRPARSARSAPTPCRPASRAAGAGQGPGEAAAVPRRGGRRAGPTSREAAALPGGARSSRGPGLPLDSTKLKALARDVRARAARSGVIALGLERARRRQLFVTVSDDLVARGVAAGTSCARPRRRSAARAAGAPRWPRAGGTEAAACTGP